MTSTMTTTFRAEPDSESIRSAKWPTADQIWSALSASAPHFADLSVTLARNQPNPDLAVYKVGPEHIARFALNDRGEQSLSAELRWVPSLVAGLPITAETPVFAGPPSDAYGRAWAIYRRIAGEAVAPNGVIDNDRSAFRLAGFCNGFHVLPPARVSSVGASDCSTSSRLDAHSQQLVRALEHIERINPDILTVDPAALLRVWAKACDPQRMTPHPTWIHGDLYPARLVHRDGILAGIVDFTRVAIGDPAADLAVCWYLFSAQRRSMFFSWVNDRDPNIVMRSRAWAVLRSVLTLADGSSTPESTSWARAGLERAVAG